ncbi:sporulation integral membrane protein YtvI [Paenibacillus forsythiae]|uniref:Sporulation integral membrane protein YtvI n=1 Tax=Paenibacillus forsythiae TaxID=365616 RepID=A0ABU3H393_9BACL|nr:sporulation integral membrane protein YtvI [Paenibacillus forsythiae]MDT3425181.1 sporulation integral membrane protein YtvI [Paenibacillus forsythiae]
MDRLTLTRLLRGLWVLLAALLVLFSLYVLLPLLYPLCLAWLLAYSIRPVVEALKRLRLPTWLAVILSLALYIGSAGIVLTALVTRLVKELAALAQTFNLHAPQWHEQLQSWSRSNRLQNIINQINLFYNSNPDYHSTIDSHISKTTETLGVAATRLVTGVFNLIVKLIASLPSLGTVLIVVILAAFFLATGWERRGRMLSVILPDGFRGAAAEIWIDLRRAFFGYLLAQLVLISITGAIVIVGLMLLGVKSAFVLGLMIGLVDLMPYLGVGIVMIPWALYSFMTGDMQLAIGLSVLYGITLITRQVLEPKLLASSVGLDPLAMLIGMFAGLKLLGAGGLILGPVALVIAGAFWRAGVFRSLHSYILSGRLR